MRSATLAVDGATLYYEIRGHGPLLLLIPGGGGDASHADPLADALASHFTVVAYDVRGYSRSTLHSGRPEPQHVAVQAEDAARLITHLSPHAPAYVVGGSNGAIVGLDLLARRPHLVHTLLAHEPPCFAILPDAPTHHAWIERVYQLLLDQGPAAAGAEFLAGIGEAMDPSPAPAQRTARDTETWARLAANGPIMMRYELREFTSYQPDLAALAAVSDRLILAAGHGTGSLLPARPAAALAERLGLPLRRLPGKHNGPRAHAPAFAARLIDLFTDRSPRPAVAAPPPPAPHCPPPAHPRGR
ncbi:alpha/beta fold hydrolase [Nocardia pseudobrasiliensis]|uniref:Pimeloyl-ACP methyl ester carboxylesterase n=1 Tax=Nocardia pseudobrasiliensis TaxID=45979 RepID=A0A370HYF2_9NOCA|nr:alpha/beta fold hydrolase [Nocardia pseudobrasiliensis]RDI63518.1 pimeloyl-ACP methyl ester carboxylesterase [Nocardia pseudobrasiliensis]